MLGCHVVHACLRQGRAVRAFVRPQSNRRLLAELDLEFATGDLGDRASLARAMAGCEAVVHAAAPYPHRHFGRRRFLADARAGMAGFLCTALDAARQGSLRRCVYVSSATTIGRAHGRPAREDDRPPIDDPSPYFRVKAMLEAMAAEAARSGLPLTIVNPTFCVDEFDDHRTTAQLLVPLAKGWLPAYVPGRLNAVATRDVGAGIVSALERGRRGARYILGGENLTSRAFLERCAHIAGVAPPRLALPVPLAELISLKTELLAYPFRAAPLFPLTGIRMIKHGQAYDISRARDELGYAPTPLDPAIERAFAWYRKRGFI